MPAAPALDLTARISFIHLLLINVERLVCRTQSKSSCLPVASLVRFPDPIPSLQLYYEPSLLLRIGPSQCPASARSPLRLLPLGFLPWHQSDWFLQFHATACIRFTPSLRRSPSAPSSGTLRTLSQANHTHLISTTLVIINDASSRVHLRSSHACLPAQVASCFSSNAHHHGS